MIEFYISVGSAYLRTAVLSEPEISRLLGSKGCLHSPQAEDTRSMPTEGAQRDAGDVVSQFYTYYNDSNIDGVMSLMAEDCKYHDMIYSDPFEGHEEIRAYFEKV